MEVNYKNVKYSIKFGPGRRLTRGVAVLGCLMIGGFLVTQTNKTLFYPVFGFVPSLAIGGLRIWQFVTAIFLHINISHVLFNLFGLYMFGSPVETALRTREFIKYFLICGVGGFVLTYILWCIGVTPNNISIGASGGVYGLLLAFSVLFPKQKVLVLFFIPMQAKWLALSFGVLEMLLAFRNDGINHFGHLGGLLAGLGYVCHIRSFEFVKKKILQS